MSGVARVVVAGAGRREVLELPWEATLQEVLTRAREALGVGGLEVELWCEDGTTLGNKLHRTLGELRDRRLCPRLEFELRGAAGA